MAVATVILAVVTLLLAIATVLLVWATRKSAREARDDAAAQLRSSYRPLLIEVLPSGPVTADMGADTDGRISQAFAGRDREWIDPRSVCVRLERGMTYVSVPLRNVGRGLAIVDAAAIELSGDAIGRLRGEPTARKTRVPPGETTRIDVISGYDSQAKIEAPWTLLVPYEDFAGGQRTTATITLECPYGPQDAWFVTDIQQAADA